MTQRDLLTCPNCDVPWYIEQVRAGWAAVQPGSWWCPVTQHWTARCACTVLQGGEEGDLYRQMEGVQYG